jgi:NAD(P)H-dependent FMN reductase
MPTLLVVHHTPSPAMHSMLEAVRAGASNDEIEGVEVVVRAALAATAVDVMGADGYVLGTTANLGYMSGALKHFFDTIYYPCLEETKARPFGLFVHGNNDTTGAVKAVGKVVTGLEWTQVTDHVEVIGEPSKADLDACWEVGAVVAATLAS